MDDLLSKSQPVISVITEIELLCWKTTDERDMEILQNFIDDVRVIEMEKTIKYKAVDIRKKYRIKLPDAIIAATAITYELILISRNVSDFKNIRELQLINPWDI